VRGGQQLFFQHVLTDDTQIDHAIHDQSRNVVITYAQNIDRHVFCESDQALFLQIDFKSHSEPEVRVTRRSGDQISALLSVNVFYPA
jgi:hypothetical protein